MADKEQLDPRFDGAPTSKGNSVKLSDNGIASLEDIGDDLVKVTDRDGRVSIFPRDAEPANMSSEQRQAAVDAAIDNSPVRNDLSPAHSDFDENATLAEAPEEPENLKVVNTGLGVDAEANSDEEGK
jgi:hypothetical protein